MTDAHKLHAAENEIERLRDGISDALPALEIQGQWNEWTGALLMTEDQWGLIMDAGIELKKILEGEKDGGI